MSGGAPTAVSPWRAFATVAYFLAVLLVLDPGLGFVFGAWPPHPSLLPWRHISGGLVIVAAPMIAAAAVGILVAARVRGDMRVLKVLRLSGLIVLAVGVAFTVLYALDSAEIYQDLPAAQTRSFVEIEMRLVVMMAIGLAFVWVFSRTAADLLLVFHSSMDRQAPHNLQ